MKLPSYIAEQLTLNEQVEYERDLYQAALTLVCKELKWEEYSPIYQALIETAMEEVNTRWEIEPEPPDIKGARVDEAYERSVDK